MAKTEQIQKCTLTAPQETYVRANHNRMTLQEMARNLNVSAMHISRNMQALNLQTKHRRRPRTKVAEVETNGFFNVDKYKLVFGI